MKTCPACRKRFEPSFTTLQVVCSLACAQDWAKEYPARLEAHRARLARKERAEYRAASKTPQGAATEAQRAFNAWVRARDAGKPCISCGHPDDGTRKRNAGHYRPAGSNPALRFDEANCHGQCERCNSYLSGNLPAYRIELIRRVGLAEAERLEGPHELPRRTRADFEAIRDEFKAKLREARK